MTDGFGAGICGEFMDGPVGGGDRLFSGAAGSSLNAFGGEAVGGSVAKLAVGEDFHHQTAIATAAVALGISVANGTSGSGLGDQSQTDPIGVNVHAIEVLMQVHHVLKLFPYRKTI